MGMGGTGAAWQTWTFVNWKLFLKEAKDVSTALIAAEQRIGELLLEIPKATTNHKNPDLEIRPVSNFKTKSEIISEQGYSKDEASDFQERSKAGVYIFP